MSLKGSLTHTLCVENLEFLWTRGNALKVNKKSGRYTGCWIVLLTVIYKHTFA